MTRTTSVTCPTAAGCIRGNRCSPSPSTGGCATGRPRPTRGRVAADSRRGGARRWDPGLFGSVGQRLLKDPAPGQGPGLSGSGLIRATSHDRAPDCCIPPGIRSQTSRFPRTPRTAKWAGTGPPPLLGIGVSGSGVVRAGAFLPRQRRRRGWPKTSTQSRSPDTVSTLDPEVDRARVDTGMRETLGFMFGLRSATGYP